ncbi:MAG: 50S ribosome-binding GTPase [Microthrixaceae bacterium]|nr:50S ribosome-binding GTPase [Microthrixaceae bacterium]
MSCHDEGQLLTERPAASVALVGSPNAGKTTLFNHLCGVRAKTANYPGVTVSRREARVHLEDHDLALVDLPGTYSLEPISPDEKVVLDSLHGRIEGVEAPDALLVVADATTLERSLLLVADVLALGKPTALVLTMIDEVAARGGALDLEALSRALGVPVVGVVGHRGVGLDDVRVLLASPETWPRPVLTPPEHGAERAAWVASIVASAVTTLQDDSRTRRIDAVLLHPVAGSIIFLATMLLVFQAVFTLAVPAMDALDSLFVWMAEQVSSTVPGQFGAFLADGIIGGVGGVLVFLPPDHPAVPAVGPAREGRLPRQGGVPRRPRDGPLRPGGAQLRVDAVGVRLRDPRHHVHPHHPQRSPPARHDDGDTADDLLRTPAGLHPDDRRLHPRVTGPSAPSEPRASRCWACTCSARSRASCTRRS